MHPGAPLKSLHFITLASLDTGEAAKPRGVNNATL